MSAWGTSIQVLEATVRVRLPGDVGVSVEKVGSQAKPWLQDDVHEATKDRT